MAQPGNFTPILLYSSSASTNVPLAANLTNSANGAEIAINIADKNLFFKDSGGTVNTVPIRQSNTSSNGWLSATDWNTFNNKAPATSGTSLLYGNGTGGFSNVTIGSGISFAGGILSATGSGGTVTSVTGTSPVVSSGGTTPAISMPAATTSVNGYLTSTDWNTFNNKQPAGTYVNSVSGTAGRITSTGGVTPVIDLASGIATAGTTGSSTLIPVVTIDTYGRVTGITTASNPQGTVTSVAALTLGTTGTDLSSTVANGTTTPVITLNVPTASATNRGALSATDWTTFNNKQPAGSYLTAVSVVSANGFAGTSSGGTTPALTLSTSITGLLKGNGTAISAATSGTDYAPATSGSSILYGNGAGGFSNVTIGTGLTFIGGTLASTASGGTVTSVAASVPSFLSISGSPITTSGTLAITYSGTALPVANGGTGLTTLASGYIPFGNGTSSFGSSGSFYWDNSAVSLNAFGTATFGSTNAAGGGGTNKWVAIQGNGVSYGAGNAGNYGGILLSANANYTADARQFLITNAYGVSNFAIIRSVNATTAPSLGTGGAIASGIVDFMISNTGGVSIGNTTDPGAGSLSVNTNILQGLSSLTATFGGIQANGVVSATGFGCRTGTGGSYGGNRFNLNWTGSVMNLYVDNVNLGSITTVSDYRVKHNVEAINSSALNKVTQLRPVSYNFKNFGIFKDDNVVREGFIAHELQQIIPSAVNGEKDAVDLEGNIQPQSLDLAPVVAVLTKALQELNEKFDAYVASHP